jgi:hypothetical protein
MIRPDALALFLLALLPACAPPAGFEAARQKVAAGPYPQLAPLAEVQEVAGMPQLTDADAAALQARATRLQKRAAALPQTATDEETRARLNRAIGAP